MFGHHQIELVSILHMFIIYIYIFFCGFLPYQDSQYTNYAMGRVPSNLCHQKRSSSQSTTQTQLSEYKQLLQLVICTTEAGKFVSTMKQVKFKKSKQ